MTGLPWNEILWKVPVAICYQLELLYWQREGTVFVKDQRRLLREKL
jgi:hypothetical protein